VDEMIQRLRDAHAKTTPGDWGVDWIHCPDVDLWPLCITSSDEHPEHRRICTFGDRSDYHRFSNNNARFIALAHNALPAILDRLSAAEARVKELEWERDAGVGLIAAERERQVSKEGWTPEHDDAHEMGELAAAAIAYASPFESIKARSLICEEHVCEVWPWDPEAFKPGDRIRDLTKAGALIAAEIDRLQRLAAAAAARAEKEGDRNAQ
jgi:hypothetical protein